MRQDTPAAIHLRRVSRYPDVMSIRRALVSILGCAVVIVGWPSSSHEAGREPVQGVSIEAKDLTPAEMAQVRRLVRPTGKEPWLIYGFRYGLGAKSIPRRTLLALYLQPDVERGRLRRGRVLHAEISAPPLEGQKASPGIQFTGKYVQIVAIGRRPEEVNGKWDLNRPFLVDGEFTTRPSSGSSHSFGEVSKDLNHRTPGRPPESAVHLRSPAFVASTTEWR